MANFTFDTFAAHITALAVEVEVAGCAGIAAAAHRVHEEIPKVIGEYQPAMGPFPAWAPLAESTLEEKSRLGFETPKPELRTGELLDSYEVEAHGNVAGVGSSSGVALAQEWGVPSRYLPPRSILGVATLRAEPEAFLLWVEALRAVLK